MKTTQNLFFAAACGILIAAGYDNQNGRAGATGSPGEGTCANSGCHTGFAVNSQGGSVVINSDIPDWQYTPGTTYNISVTVAGEGRPLFGLGFEALNAAGQNAGTLTPGTGTQIKTATIQGNVRNNIVHTTNGGASMNSHTFNFTWQAPAENIGNVTFYAAGNAANANGATSGDHIYTTSQVVEPDGIIQIAETSASGPSVKLFPNPTQDDLTIELTLAKGGHVRIEMVNTIGAVVMTAVNEPLSSGDHVFYRDISALPAGNYLVVISAESGRSVRQIKKL